MPSWQVSLDKTCKPDLTKRLPDKKISWLLMHKLSKYIIKHVKGKSRPFGSEIQFCPDIVKKRWPQKMDDFLDILTLKGAGRRPVDTKSTFIWLFWGITVQTSFAKGQWHRDWAAAIFGGSTRKSVNYRNSLVFGPLLGNEERYWDGA